MSETRNRRPKSTSTRPSTGHQEQGQAMDDDSINSDVPPLTVKKTSQWLTLAIGSGAFAAFNGVFAKLTTTAQTHGFVSTLSHLFGFADDSRFMELFIRAIFFGLNLLSNAIMWILFTRALTAATSTTRVAILNTSSNFMVTAVLGMVVFSESLPPLWWFGAGLLVAGSVIIGAREGQEQKNTDVGKDVSLDDEIMTGDVASMGFGAGGIGQSVLADERFRDEPGHLDSDEENSKIIR